MDKPNLKNGSDFEEFGTIKALLKALQISTEEKLLLKLLLIYGIDVILCRIVPDARFITKLDWTDYLDLRTMYNLIPFIALAWLLRSRCSRGALLFIRGISWVGMIYHGYTAALQHYACPFFLLFRLAIIIKAEMPMSTYFSLIVLIVPVAFAILSFYTYRSSTRLYALKTPTKQGIQTSKTFTFMLYAMSIALLIVFDAYLLGAFTPDVQLEENWIAHAAPSFAGGAGSKNEPYLISNAEELARLAYVVNGKMQDTDGIEFSRKHYELTTDIDLKKYEWTPIGERKQGNISPFSGHFNGRGFRISNLQIGKSEPFYFPLPGLKPPALAGKLSASFFLFWYAIYEG